MSSGAKTPQRSGENFNSTALYDVSAHEILLHYQCVASWAAQESFGFRGKIV